MATSVRTVTADVVRVDFGGCVVKWTDGTLVRARARGRLMGERKALGNTVVVGDRALLETPGATADPLIVGIEPRRNAFRGARPDASSPSRSSPPTSTRSFTWHRGRIPSSGRVSPTASSVRPSTRAFPPGW